MEYIFSHKVIRTPIDTINIIGAGGINQGTISEIWGPPGSGKTAFAYDTASNFLMDNETGWVLIIDPELSVNLIRLEHVFKLDMTRVKIVNAHTLEAGYGEIYKLYKEHDEAIKTKKVPIPWLVVWDTIAASKPAAEVAAALEGKDPMNAGGMGLKARVNEINLAITMSGLWNRPVTIFLLNQVRTTGFGSYQGPHDTSTGGNALKHTGHYRFAFRGVKKLFDELLGMNTGTLSKVSVEKSKFGPTLRDIPVTIDDRSGGRIVPTDEAAQMLTSLNLLGHSGGPWYKFKDEEVGYTWAKSRLSENSGNWISENPTTRLKCLDIMARHFRMNFYTLDIVYEKIGLKLGELNDEQKKQREELVSKFDFSKVIKPDQESIK